MEQTEDICKLVALFERQCPIFVFAWYLADNRDQGHWRKYAFALQKVGKGRLTLKKEQLSALRSAYDQDDAFAWLLTGGFGKSIEYKCLPFYSITS